MKKTLAVLSATAILMSSFSALANDAAIANIMSKYDNGALTQVQAQQLSREIEVGFQSGEVTNADLKDYFRENIGPKSKKLIALLDRAEIGAVDKEEVQKEFLKAVKDLGDGAHFKANDTVCGTIIVGSFIIAASAGLFTLIYGLTALKNANDIRDMNNDIEKANLRIQQIQNDPTIASSSTTLISTTSTANGTSTTTIATTQTPPTKEVLIAKQQRIINDAKTGLIDSKSDYEYEMNFTKVSSTGLLIGIAGLGVAAGVCD